MTAWERLLPSARPAVRSWRIFMTLPMSAREEAPDSSMAVDTSSFTSSGERGAGR